MKRHTVCIESPGGGSQFVEVERESVIAEGVLDLIASGIDEDAHFRSGDWRDVDDDELEAVLNDSQAIDKVLQQLRPGLVQKLGEVLQDRRKEASKGTTT